jgi:hypothetical protein
MLLEAFAPLAAHIDLIKAAVLGIVEGFTEYLPVSSTGHLLLMEHVLGWGDSDFGKTFAVLIQLGAILALLSIYFGRLWALATHMFKDWAAARFVIGVLLAFLPAAVIGALTGSYIKAYLFDVRIVCIALIVGGFVLLAVDRMRLKPRYHEATDFTLPMYFGIGDPRRIARGRDHRRRDAVRRRPALGGGIFILVGDADDGGRLRLRDIQEPARSRAERGQYGPYRGRLRVLVHFRVDRGEDVSALRAAPHIRGVRLVADYRRQPWNLRAVFDVDAD